jgi:hypothetical protein
MRSYPCSAAPSRFHHPKAPAARIFVCFSSRSVLSVCHSDICYCAPGKPIPLRSGPPL